MKKLDIASPKRALIELRFRTSLCQEDGMQPRDLADGAEHSAPLPGEEQEHFIGWGVMGLPFASGHVLGLRRWPVSSIGPGYTSVWHRRPDGEWIFYADLDPWLACTRYFGSEVAEASVTHIVIEWTGPCDFRVTMDEIGFVWNVRLKLTPATRLLNATARFFPERLWRDERALAVMGAFAGPMLGAGRVALRGRLSNGQRFVTTPRLIWAIEESRAMLGGEDFGPPGPLKQQVRLGDFWIPQRGLVAFGQALLEPFDPTRHDSRISKSGQAVSP